MDWPETITLVVTILVAVLGGIIYGNRRLDDITSNVNARFATVDSRFAELRGDMNARFAELHTDMNTRFGELHADFRELRTLILEALRSRAS